MTLDRSSLAAVNVFVFLRKMLIFSMAVLKQVILPKIQPNGGQDEETV